MKLMAQLFGYSYANAKRGEKHTQRCLMVDDEWASKCDTQTYVNWYKTAGKKAEQRMSISNIKSLNRFWENDLLMFSQHMVQSNKLLILCNLTTKGATIVNAKRDSYAAE